MTAATAVDSTLNYATTDSPVGTILLTSDGASLTGLYLDDFEKILARVGTAAHTDPREEPGLEILAATRQQLGEYFTGTRTEFDLPLAPYGTDFQRTVWEALRRIDYGTTCNYGELAEEINRPTAARAVGAANGRNPISIIVPCHRVIGANGSLTGYAWGEERKRALLDLEASVVAARR